MLSAIKSRVSQHKALFGVSRGRPLRLLGLPLLPPPNGAVAQSRLFAESFGTILTMRWWYAVQFNGVEAVSKILAANEVYRCSRADHGRLGIAGRRRAT